MMNPGSNNGGSGSSWLFSGPGSGSGFQPTDPLGGPHGGHLPPHTTSSTFTPTSAYEDSRSGQHTPMLPFSQTDLSFVDTLTTHPSQQKTQQQQQQSQHFVTSSTLHPGSTLSVVEAASEAATGMYCTYLYLIIWMGQIMYGTADSKLWRKFWTDLPTVDQVNPNWSKIHFQLQWSRRIYIWMMGQFI